MTDKISMDRLLFLLRRLRERLWVKPLAICILSIFGAFVARFADGTVLREFVPEISAESVETLLSVIASAMMVIATLAVASMVSAYASASNAATPRAFAVVLADDVSQNALSTFIGAFIFSIVALVAIKNQFFDVAGRFTLFTLTLLVFVIVIVTFVRWVDCIARLGRLGTTITSVENATAAAMKQRLNAPTLQGTKIDPDATPGNPLFGNKVGYVQHINMEALQKCAESMNDSITVAALPGTFVSPAQPLAYLSGSHSVDEESIRNAFFVNHNRHFEDDPRFGLIVLGEIAGRALSPAVNDPGTAIQVIGALARLFVLWGQSGEGRKIKQPRFDRVSVPLLSVADMFDDAFTAIARDGAYAVEVSIRLQKALHSLTMLDDAQIRSAAHRHSKLALKRVALTMKLDEDKREVERAASALNNEKPETFNNY